MPDNLTQPTPTPNSPQSMAPPQPLQMDDPQNQVDVALSTPSMGSEEVPLAMQTQDPSPEIETKLPDPPPVPPAPPAPTEPEIPPAIQDTPPAPSPEPPPAPSPVVPPAPIDIPVAPPSEPEAPAPQEVPVETKKKSGGVAKVMGMVAGIVLFALALVYGGYYAFLNFGGAEVPTIAYVTKFIKDENGKVIRNPAYDPNDVANERERNQDLGLGEFAPDPKIEKANSKAACEAISGAQWCDYGFCMKNDGTQGNCNNRAVELGYTVTIGSVKCVQNEDTGIWYADPAMGYSSNSGEGAVGVVDGKSVKEQVDLQCKSLIENPNFFGNAKYICKEGVKGYSGGQCTANNGVAFTGNLGCFCGTVQVDTGSGHTSYQSTCGCDDEDEPPSKTTSSSLMCESLTRTPTTTPEIGTALKFTCLGSTVPAGATILSYDYRYAINDGPWQTMEVDRSKQPEGRLTIATCGSYKVQCRACGTIDGKAVCDPIWSGATTQ